MTDLSLGFPQLTKATLDGTAFTEFSKLFELNFPHAQERFSEVQDLELWYPRVVMSWVRITALAVDADLVLDALASDQSNNRVVSPECISEVDRNVSDLLHLHNDLYTILPRITKHAPDIGHRLMNQIWLARDVVVKRDETLHPCFLNNSHWKATWISKSEMILRRDSELEALLLKHGAGFLRHHEVPGETDAARLALGHGLQL